MAPPSSTSLFHLPDIFSPRRGRIVSNVECEEHMHDLARAVTTGSGTGRRTGMMEGTSTNGFLASMPTVCDNESESNAKNISRLPHMDRIQDLTASILERVSHITISADSWTASSPTVAEVSFTEDEAKCEDDEPDSPPPSVVPSSLVASPLRVKHKRRLAPPTPLRLLHSESSSLNTTTPRTCNNVIFPLSSRATKRRRQHGPPTLPTSPIVDLNARINHGPMLVYSPFSRHDARLDRFASATTTEISSELTATTTPDRTIVNPFLVPMAAATTTWETPTPKARRRRRRLRMRTLPFPSFPCLSPMQQQQQESTLYCSPISKQPAFL